MTAVVTARTRQTDSKIAGKELGVALKLQCGSPPPAAVLLFASPIHDFPLLLEAIRSECSASAIVGCSSAGEFTAEGLLSASAVALAIQSDNLQFAVHVQPNLHSGIHEAASSLAASFVDGHDAAYPFHTVLLLMDVLAGYGEQFLEAFTSATQGRYQIFGGGAADDAAFHETFVFANGQALSDAAVALEIRSKQPVGLGVSHGWTPASPSMKVTESEGLTIRRIDGIPAVEVFESFARRRGRTFEREAPLPFFLHHVIGIESGDTYKLRVPLQVTEDGALHCATEVPAGSTIRIMRTSDTSSSEAAFFAAGRARAGLQGNPPSVAIFFDCAATRLRLGDDFQGSVDEISRVLGTQSCIGCNTYGQFARLDGQSSAFHNCTAVVCALPD